jgi:hypothetical protein
MRQLASSSSCPLHYSTASRPSAQPPLSCPCCRADGVGPRWYMPPSKCCDGRGRPLVPTILDGFAKWSTYEWKDDWWLTPLPVLEYKIPADLHCKHCILQW